jgi:hypothetical protein
MEFSHMSWCPTGGDHELPGVCRIRRVQDPADANCLVVELTGVHCDHQSLAVLGTGDFTADVDWLLTALTELRSLMESGRADVDCAGHGHSRWPTS